MSTLNEIFKDLIIRTMPSMHPNSWMLWGERSAIIVIDGVSFKFEWDGISISFPDKVEFIGLRMVDDEVKL